MEGHCNFASILGYPDGAYGSKLWIRDPDDPASNIHETNSPFQYPKGKKYPEDRFRREKGFERFLHPVS